MTTVRRRLTGLIAALLIVGILIGLPMLLLAIGASPVPTGGIPTFEAIKTALTSPDDGTLAISLIKLVGWISWAFLTLSILLEVAARARGVQAPRLPGLRVPQNAARGLVGAALMLLLVAPMADAAPAAAASPTSATAAASTADPIGTGAVSNLDTGHPAADPQQPTTPATAVDAPIETPTVDHTVRRGETLWAIAQNQLGDGHRYREIVELNQDLLGGKASFIKAGWMLKIPAAPDTDAAAGRVVVEKGDTLSEIAQDQLGDATRYPEIFKASSAITQPGGTHLVDPDVIDVGWTVQMPGPSTPTPTTQPQPQRQSTPETQARPAPEPRSEATPEVSRPKATPAPVAPSATPSQGAQTPSAATSEHLQEDSDWIVRTSYGVGALLAAGVLSLLAARRRTQQRRRRPGQAMPLPTGRPAEVEQELRATADSLSVETIDIALRSLARACTETGVALPAVRAARLTATQFDLYLAEPAHLPHPWAGTADTTVWTLEVANTAALADVDVNDVPAPYPALVTIGHDEEDGHVFLDLEYIGALGVVGDPAATREILAALAIELATSTWADDLQVTIVGAFPDLEDTLQTGRIRYLPSVGRILDDLLYRAEQDRRALADNGAPDLHTARVTAAAPDAWVPEIVLLAGEITDRQRTQLEQLVKDLPRVALAAVTSGVSVGEWGLDLTTADDTGGDLATLSPIGLQLRPQRLPAAHYGHLLEVMSLADVEELQGEGAPEPSLSEVEAVTPFDEPERAAVDPQGADLGSTAQPAVHLPEVTTGMLQAAAARDDEDSGVEDRPATHTLDPDEHAPPGSGAGLPTDTHVDPGDTGATAVDQVDESATAEAADAEAADADRAPGSSGPATTPPAPVITPTASAVEIPPGEPVLPAPRVFVLGPVEILNAGGPVEPTKRARLLEYAAYLALHPGASYTAIDTAIWPDRSNEDNANTRNPATTKLRRWIGTDPDGHEYLPRQGRADNGYAFLPSVTTDADDWDTLVQRDPANAATEHLEDALALVRGIPFEGAHRKRYGWAEPLKQRLISEIVDASYELARRRLMEGRWRAAEQAVIVGLRIEPAQENLWRLRILAAHESRNPSAEAMAIERLLTTTEKLECDLEPETEQLLAALKTPGTDFDQLMANAL